MHSDPRLVIPGPGLSKRFSSVAGILNYSHSFCLKIRVLIILMQLVMVSVIGFGRIIQRVIKKRIYIWNYFVQIECYWKFTGFIDNRRRSG